MTTMQFYIFNNWNTCNIIEKRISYVTDLLLKGYSRNWVWVDEVGFNLDQLRRTKALSLAGQKVSVTIQSHSRRLNVISSLGQDGIVLNKFKFSTINKRNDDSGGVNASDFKGFLFELAAKIPKKKYHNFGQCCNSPCRRSKRCL